MSFAVVDGRGVGLAATLAIALTLTACGSEPSPATDHAVADNAAATVTPMAVPSLQAQPAEPEGIEPPSATLAELGEIRPGMETPGTEMPADQAYGRWKVIDAAGAPSGRTMIGRTLSFTEDALGWINADGKVEPGCPDMYHIALEAMQVKQAAPLFRPGWAKFRLPPDQVGPMHVMECDGEGVFGPPETGGSSFFPVGKDRLVMNWLDGTVLLLRKEGKGS